MKKLVITALALMMAAMFPGMSLRAQDLAHYKQVVKELSSAKYQGRGYACGGANKAGKYLLKEYRKAGVDEVVCQPFTIDINTFPGKMELSVDGRKLNPGVDFSMREYSPVCAAGRAEHPLRERERRRLPLLPHALRHLRERDFCQLRADFPVGAGFCREVLSSRSSVGDMPYLRRKAVQKWLWYS